MISKKKRILERRDAGNPQAGFLSNFTEG